MGLLVDEEGAKIFTHLSEHLQFVHSAARLTQAHFLSAHVDRSVQLQHWSSVFCFLFNDFNFEFEFDGFEFELTPFGSGLKLIES